jgi:hypothetical protein
MLLVAQAGSRTCACIDFGKNSPSNRKAQHTTQTLDSGNSTGNVASMQEVKKGHP